MLVCYRRLTPLFQFSLSAVTLVYLSQWGEAPPPPTATTQAADRNTVAMAQ
jgi:hypothetical protein